MRVLRLVGAVLVGALFANPDHPLPIEAGHNFLLLEDVIDAVGVVDDGVRHEGDPLAAGPQAPAQVAVKTLRAVHVRAPRGGM